jgi:membrane fusion protein (multidrug efflux system)
MLAEFRASISEGFPVWAVPSTLLTWRYDSNLIGRNAGRDCDLAQEVKMRLLICGLLLLLSLSDPAAAQQGPPSAIPVGTVTAERRPIAENREFVGRVEAINRVEVRARVTGYLEEVLFKEGDLIKEGAPLYRIEKGLFQAAVEQAQGALERSKAAKVLSEVQLQRAEELLAKNVGSVQARDQALAADGAAKGAIMQDEANLSSATINLGYTDIVSPISGKIGRTNVTKGNVIGPDSGPLCMIVSQDPMYVTFPVSQLEFLRAQETGRKADIKSFKIRLRFADGSSYSEVGQANFIDVTVDRATDTVLARATFPNPSGGLIDGQLVRVWVESGTPEQKVVVPQAALIADQEGIYVFVVEDGKAVVKRIKPAGEIGADVVVEQGLSGGEQIIVQGLQNVRPGVPVQASPMPQSLNRS